MRISEAAKRLGMSPRMLRYREDLGLLPVLRGRPAGRGPAHRQFTDEDLAAIRAGVELERCYDITPAALAFGLRVLTEPGIRAAVTDFGRRTGHVPPLAMPGRALDFEKERALRALGGPLPRGSARARPGPPGTETERAPARSWRAEARPVDASGGTQPPGSQAAQQAARPVES